jgi:hypothetical protein
MTEVKRYAVPILYVVRAVLIPQISFFLSRVTTATCGADGTAATVI